MDTLPCKPYLMISIIRLPGNPGTKPNTAWEYVLPAWIASCMIQRCLWYRWVLVLQGTFLFWALSLIHKGLAIDDEDNQTQLWIMNKIINITATCWRNGYLSQIFVICPTLVTLSQLLECHHSLAKNMEWMQINKQDNQHSHHVSCYCNTVASGKRVMFTSWWTEPLC
jgi:hypothetical protein